MLGLSTGPIDFEPLFASEDAEANRPSFCLREILEDELDVLEGDYDRAKLEKEPAHVIAEKLAALKHQEERITQANIHLCAIKDELNKGEQSMLTVDRVLSNVACTYITLHSFNEWLTRGGSQGLSGELSGDVELAGSSPTEVENTKKRKVRAKLLEQEVAILTEIKKLGIDPMALPRNPRGISGVKADVRAALKNSQLFAGSTVFNKAWDRLREYRHIKDAD